MGKTEITVEKMGVVGKGGKMETMEREKNKSVKCSKGRYSLNIVQKLFSCILYILYMPILGLMQTIFFGVKQKMNDHV